MYCRAIASSVIQRFSRRTSWYGPRRINFFNFCGNDDFLHFSRQSAFFLHTGNEKGMFAVRRSIGNGHRLEFSFSPNPIQNQLEDTVCTVSILYVCRSALGRKITHHTPLCIVEVRTKRRNPISVAKIQLSKKSKRASIG